MITMGVGRIVNVERSLTSVSGAPRSRLHAPSRRLFLQAGGVALAGGVLGSMVGCGGFGNAGGNPGGTGESTGDGWTYLLEAIAVAAADIVGVYCIGVPVGTLARGVAQTVSSTTSSDAKPGRVTIEHPAASMAQGPMGTMVSYNMPARSTSSGKSTVDSQGIAYAQLSNPTEDDISYVELHTYDGTPVKPQYTGLTGYLRTPLRPGEDLFMTGLPRLNYKKIVFQTVKGTTGEILCSSGGACDYG